MSVVENSPSTATAAFPIDPLSLMAVQSDESLKRRTVHGILESYNGNYDALAEMVQNAVDAVEDAMLLDLPGPFVVDVTIDLDENTIAVLDTGIGLSSKDIARVCIPHASFKTHEELLERRKRTKAPYRGYKGVGLTFLAYGTNDLTLHSKKDGTFTRARMQYGRAWADGERPTSAIMDIDNRESPLDSYERGTVVRLAFSKATKPRSLSRLAQTHLAWETILRTKTAIGQVRIAVEPLQSFECHLTTICQGKRESSKIVPSFYYPHVVHRKHPFRFLDLVSYWSKHPENADIPVDKQRQDGVFLSWDTKKITEQLTQDQREQFSEELQAYSPTLYAFFPYQASVWRELNQLTSGKERGHLAPGLMLAVNHQRLADTFDFEPSRFVDLSRNMMVLVDLENAKPDLGRKTLQTEVLGLAQRAADRAVQYLAKQRPFLRQAGEGPTPGQREVERDHDDWIFNVRTHASKSPLHVPPIAYVSEPLVEQDVVGIFHQLAATGAFPGIRVYATSQSKTYDCLIQFECNREQRNLLYGGPDSNPLGVSPFILGDGPQFRSPILTVEFKNNLDGLIGDLEGEESKKAFAKIDVCVCWGQILDEFRGYDVEEVREANIDHRQFPGVTHLLRKDGSHHVVQVIMLAKAISLLKSGHMDLS